MDFTKEYGEQEQTEKKPGSRKRLALKIIVALLLLAVIAVVVTVGVNMMINLNFGVSFYQIRSDKVSNNIRIVELADLHNNEYGKQNSKLIAKIKTLQPDLIVYAGDMMNDHDNDYSVLFDLSDKLAKIAPIYACYGNNELTQQLFVDKTFVTQLKQHHVNLLSNEAKDVEIGNTVVQLIAISDNVEQFDVKSNNAKKFLNSLEPTTNCRICLTHFPELFKDKLLNRGIDVAFVGHAHGGLIRIPRLGGLYSTGEGFLPKFTAGVVEAEDGTKVVVSRGLGNEDFIPRINNQPELVVADICWY